MKIELTHKNILNKYKWLFALLVFVASFLLRMPLVDQCYEYSFEPDSGSCVQETRSFYFFFKEPSVENLPHNMNSSSTYSDGDYIFSAIGANVFAPFCKAGLINPALSDNDNSLIIFSMRWCGVFYDALTAVLVFLIVLQLSESIFLALLLTTFYFLLAPQILKVDLMRVDHFGIMVSTWVMYTSIMLYQKPFGSKFYWLSGIAAGLVTGTKLNFPFYLLILAFVLLVLGFRKQISIRNFLILAFSFLLSFAFVYQRWLFYPHEVIPRVVGIFYTGEDWIGFWGNKNYLFYIWHQFFDQGYSWPVALMIIVVYVVLIVSLILSVLNGNWLVAVFCITFIIQTIMLAISPKIGRYGMIIPVWFSIFITLLWNAFGKLNRVRLVRYGIVVLIIIPVFTYQLKGYNYALMNAENREGSIQATKIAAQKWVYQHIPDGSVIGMQYPRTSNPPIFNRPYYYVSDYFQYPFLYKEKFKTFYPPTYQTIKQHLNYLIISDKEKREHLVACKMCNLDTSLITQWQNFYDSLPYYFQHVDFMSPYANYGVKGICIYKMSDSVLNGEVLKLQATDSIINNRVQLNFNVTNCIPYRKLLFEVQISKDSGMHWLEYGSHDGYASVYRKHNDPRIADPIKQSIVPDRIYKAYYEGAFNYLLEGYEPKDRSDDFENFFVEITKSMLNDGYTFQKSAKQFLPVKVADTFLNKVSSLYASEGNLLNANVQEYTRITNLTQQVNYLQSKDKAVSTWVYKPQRDFDTGVTYFWRVRVKDKELVMSPWSNIDSFILPE